MAAPPIVLARKVPVFLGLFHTLVHAFQPCMPTPKPIAFYRIFSLSVLSNTRISQDICFAISFHLNLFFWCTTTAILRAWLHIRWRYWSSTALWMWNHDVYMTGHMRMYTCTVYIRSDARCMLWRYRGALIACEPGGDLQAVSVPLLQFGRRWRTHRQHSAALHSLYWFRHWLEIFVFVLLVCFFCLFFIFLECVRVDVMSLHWIGFRSACTSRTVYR